jgi:hypothetical protein
LRLLSGPPSVLIVLKPRIQVNDIVHTTSAELDVRDAELDEEGDPDAQVDSGLAFSEASRGW